MPKFAVPALVLVDAQNAGEAYEIVNEKVQNHYLGTDITVLLDEQLDAFTYDPDSVEVHTALDDVENREIAKGFQP